jgi:hypothetical protein
MIQSRLYENFKDFTESLVEEDGVKKEVPGPGGLEP